jgi:CDP-glucose 4,6-dehydratase
VRDAVDAYLQLAERLPDEQFVGQAFNFGTETPMSVIDLVRRILALMGKSHLEPRILNEASHEIPQQYLDCAKARRMMGWHPSFTMDEGLREAIEWYRERLTRTDWRSGVEDPIGVA